MSTYIRPDAAKLMLNEEQMRRAISIGCSRQLAALRKQRPGFYGNTGEDAWTQHIEGCGGELAGCLYYELPWSGYADELRKGGIKLPDGGDRVEFRTRLKPYYELIVHPDDCDDRAFVLVTGMMPRYFIQGWIEGHRAKRNDWWHDPSQKNRWAYFVPTGQLHPPHTLRDWLREDPF